jgi:predicted nucleic-acid-binding Zn-ribbon protein
MALGSGLKQPGISKRFPVFEVDEDDHVCLHVTCTRCTYTHIVRKDPWLAGECITRTKADKSLDGLEYWPYTRPCPYCFKPSRIPDDLLPLERRLTV